MLKNASILPRCGVNIHTISGLCQNNKESIQLYVNEKATDIKLMTKSGTVYVPFREFIQLMGYQADYSVVDREISAGSGIQHLSSYRMMVTLVDREITTNYKGQVLRLMEISIYLSVMPPG